MNRNIVSLAAAYSSLAQARRQLDAETKTLNLRVCCQGTVDWPIVLMKYFFEENNEQ